MADEAKDEAPTPTVAVDTMAMDRSIAGLVERFGISKQTLYDKYFAELSIVPMRQGQRSYITLEALEKLAFVAAKMRSGEATSVADAVQALRAKGVYVPPRLEKAAKTRKLESSSAVSHASAPPSGDDGEAGEALVAFESGGLVPWLRATPASIAQFLERLTAALTIIAAKAEELSAPASPLPSLDEYELLEKADAKRWRLSTSKLAAILKLSPGTLSSKAVFDWGGFVFTKSGKIGRESAWTITKPD